MYLKTNNYSILKQIQSQSVLCIIWRSIRIFWWRIIEIARHRRRWVVKISGHRWNTVVIRHTRIHELIWHRWIIEVIRHRWIHELIWHGWVDEMTLHWWIVHAFIVSWWSWWHPRNSTTSSSWSSKVWIFSWYPHSYHGLNYDLGRLSLIRIILGMILTPISSEPMLPAGTPSWRITFSSVVVESRKSFMCPLSTTAIVDDTCNYNDDDNRSHRGG